jgi:hypothetical protein
MKDTMSPEEVKALVDKLLMEFGVPVDETSTEPIAKKEPAFERPRGSWMDQVGRAKRP